MTRVVRARKRTARKSAGDAVRRRTTEDTVDPDDPIFRVFPLTRKRGRMKDASENLDRYLYGHDI